MCARITDAGLIVVLACGTLWPSAGVAQAAGDVTPAESSASARGRHHGHCEHDRVRGLALRGDILPLGEILQRVREYHRGRVLEIELHQYQDGYVYELLLVDDAGRVTEMQLNAASGKRLEQRGED